MRQNLHRLGFSGSVETVAADIADLEPGQPFDAVLLDAPCTATGTIRRHPDILHLKRPGDLGRLAELQSKLIARAASLVKPGGQLVYLHLLARAGGGSIAGGAFPGRPP